MDFYNKANRPIVDTDPDTTIESYLWHFQRASERIARLGKSISVPADTVLAKAGTVSEYCYLLQSGRVVSYEYSKNGDERIYAFMEGNSLILEDSALFRKACPVSFKTTRHCRMIRIAGDTLRNAVYTDPDLAMDLLQSLSDKFLSAMEEIRQMSSCSAAWKVCNLLLVFAANYGVPYDGKTLIEEKISQQLISNLLGINRITTVRTMKDLKAMGLIEQINGYYCIRDTEALKRHMNMLDRAQ